MNGDISACCRYEMHDMCPWGPCECACHDMADMVADAAEWDRAEAASLVEAW